jgi:hypothetical protein
LAIGPQSSWRGRDYCYKGGLVIGVGLSLLTTVVKRKMKLSQEGRVSGSERLNMMVKKRGLNALYICVYRWKIIFYFPIAWSNKQPLSKYFLFFIFLYLFFLRQHQYRLNKKNQRF